MDLDSTYYFKILYPEDTLSVVIDQRDKEGKLLFASQDGKRIDLSPKNLLFLYLILDLVWSKIPHFLFCWEKLNIQIFYFFYFASSSFDHFP